MTAPATDAPELPSLEPGVTFLKSDRRVTGALQSIVLDEILSAGGDAVWVDARRNAVTQHLLRVAPTRRVLRRIQVARAFTPFQHYSLIEDLHDACSDATELIVVPSIDWFYDADELRHGEGKAMLTAGLELLTDLATDHQHPVLITASEAGNYLDVLTDYSDTELHCEFTAMGPRFATDSFETLVYHEDGYIQTTLAFWREVLAERHAIKPTPTSSQEVSISGPH